MNHSNQELMHRRQQAVAAGPFNVTDAFAARACGAVLTDVEGREYLDFAGGIGVVGLAHGHPRILEAVRRQLDSYLHPCFHVMPYEPYLRVAEELNARAPGSHAKKTVLLNSGAEAVENAVKIARSFTGRPAVLCFQHGFHGRTLLGMTLTSKVVPYKKGFGPFAPEVVRTPYAYCYRCPWGAAGPESCNLECAERVEELFATAVDPDSIAALVIEPVLGEGGFVVPPRAFLERLVEMARQRGIVFVADEIQTGFGRTGSLFACDVFGIVPDLMTTAKALAGGLPLSAVTGRAEIMDGPQVGGLGGTYGGNPLACAAAMATFQVIDEEQVPARAVRLGQLIRKRFDEFKERFPLVGDVRGLGAMMALELVTDRRAKTPATAETKQLNRFAFEHGLITITAGTYGNVVRLLPPLLIEEDELQRGLDVLEAGLSFVSGESPESAG